MIYVLWLVLDGNSSRAVAAIWLCTLCDRYSITYILPAFLLLYILCILDTSPCECSSLDFGANRHVSVNSYFKCWFFLVVINDYKCVTHCGSSIDR